MKKENPLRSLPRAIKACIQHFTYHNHFASTIVSELLLHLPSPVRKRNRILQNTIDVFSHEDGPMDRKARKQLARQLLYARAYYSFVYKEYFLYKIAELDETERRKYVGWHELEHYYDLLNKMGQPGIFEHKEKTYAAFQEYYKRDFLYVEWEGQKEDFLSFFRRNAAAIIKPVDSFGGAGVEILRLSEELSPEQIWEKISPRRPFVLESLIEQAQEMNAFYPHAVNTIRYNTFYHEGKLTKLQAVFRIGRGGSIVDNATSGGIYALIDTETGRIKGPAKSFRGELFERHPDTGTLFEGSQIPRWDELNAIIDRVVKVVPEQKQVGWDFALSKDGWVMVEGNTTPAIQSFDQDHGLRGLIQDTFGTVVKMWD